MLVHTLRHLVAWALAGVLVAGTSTALGVAVFPVVTGGQALAVLSGSMSPGLPVGAMAFVRPVDPATVEPGDVITFQRAPDAPDLVTHRVLAVDAGSGVPVFTTKGDANEDPDVDPVPASAVQGELWFRVPHAGRLAAVLHSPKGLGLLIVLVCATIAAAPGPRPGRDQTPEGRTAEGWTAGNEAGGGAARPGIAELVDASEARTVVMAPVAPDLPPDATTALPAFRPARSRPLPPVPALPRVPVRVLD